MAKIVLGIATSHTPMLNTPAKDWPSFIDRDGSAIFLTRRATLRPTRSCSLAPTASPARVDAGALCRAPRRGASGGRASEAERAPRRTGRADHRR